MTWLSASEGVSSVCVLTVPLIARPESHLQGGSRRHTVPNTYLSVSTLTDGNPATNLLDSELFLPPDRGACCPLRASFLTEFGKACVPMHSRSRRLRGLPFRMLPLPLDASVLQQDVLGELRQETGWLKAQGLEGGFKMNCEASFGYKTFVSETQGKTQAGSTLSHNGLKVSGQEPRRGITL